MWDEFCPGNDTSLVSYLLFELLLDLFKNPSRIICEKNPSTAMNGIGVSACWKRCLPLAVEI
jgi:hypothetical protein